MKFSEILVYNITNREKNKTVPLKVSSLRTREGQLDPSLQWDSSEVVLATKSHQRLLVPWQPDDFLRAYALEEGDVLLADLRLTTLFRSGCAHIMRELFVDSSVHNSGGTGMNIKPALNINPYRGAYHGGALIVVSNQSLSKQNRKVMSIRRVLTSNTTGVQCLQRSEANWPIGSL